MSKDKPAFVKKEITLTEVSSELAEVDLLESKNLQIRISRKPSFRRFYDPSTVIELLLLEDFYRLLGKSLVFIQNTERSSDYVIETLVRICSEVFTFRFFQTHSVSLDTILAELQESAQEVERPQAWIIETTDVTDNLSEFCKRVALLGQCRHGIWIRGYVRDLHPKDVSFFRALFAFDMSTEEYEILRSAIPITDKIIEQMKESSGDIYEKEKVLVFLDYHYSSEAPLLKANPKVLSPATLPQLSKLKRSTVSIIFNEKGEVTVGDRIKIGNVTNIGGIQNVGKFAEHVTSNLNTAGQHELADALKSLVAAVVDSRNMTKDQKQEQVDMISQIAQEAAKPKPNKTLLKMMSDGLIAALKSIPDVAKAIASVVPLLDKLHS